MKIKILGILIATLLIATAVLPVVGTMNEIKDENNPSNAPTITGPTSGITGKTYAYHITITDPDDDHMFFLTVDFGDEIIYKNSGYERFWPNGTVILVSHRWKKPGNYEISATVQDGYGEWSEWSEPLPVNISAKKSINPLFLRFLENHLHMFPLLRQLLGL